MDRPAVVALGGHALVKPGQAGTIQEQRENLAGAIEAILELALRGRPLLLTHGNGPQVGAVLIRSEAARGRAYEIPLDVAVAQTQGETGYLLEQALRRAGLARPIATLLTQVRVDPAPCKPGKPVGPVLDTARARELREAGAVVEEDPGRGLRRLVPSPRPLEIPSIPIIARLLDGGVLVIAAGGGGIPIGVEAVVDKDFAAAELAAALGAELLLNLTSIDAVRLDFGRRGERPVDRLTSSEARRHHAEGQFAPGTMGPKIEAALRYLEAVPDGTVLITTPERGVDALRGKAGTRVTA